MLGRLQMSVQECIEAYQHLSAKVFKPKRSKFNIVGKGKDLWKLDGAFDAVALTDAIRDIVVQTGHDPDAKLYEENPKCKV